MSIAGIAGSLFFHPQSLQTTYSQQFQAQFQWLGQDLQAGNITSAQQDFATLQQDFQQSTQVQHHHHHHAHAAQPQSSAAQPQTPIAQALKALGQDLQSGNVSAAQQAFSTLQQEFLQLGGMAATTNTTAPAGSINLTA